MLAGLPCYFSASMYQLGRFRNVASAQLELLKSCMACMAVEFMYGIHSSEL